MKKIRRLKKENDFLERPSMEISALGGCHERNPGGRWMQWYLWSEPHVSGIEPEAARTCRNPQWTHHLPCHGGNWDQPSSQAQTERDHECRQGSQYTSQFYQDAIRKYDIQQSMNSAGGRWHDNARCESMWGRMKSELLYERYDIEEMTTDERRTIIWRYFIGCWNNRRICSANDGLPPMVKRQQYEDSLKEAA